MANKYVVSNHFKTLGKLLEENDLLNKPEHSFNVNESGMCMNCKNGKLVVKKGAKQAHSTAKSQRDHITVNCCLSANWQTIPPFITYEKAFPLAPYRSEGMVNAFYGKSENGNMDKVTFCTWATDHFIKLKNHFGKRILIIDGHGSRISIEIIQAAIDNNVILYCFAAYTKHILEPLDVAV